MLSRPSDRATEERARMIYAQHLARSGNSVNAQQARGEPWERLPWYHQAAISGIADALRARDELIDRVTVSPERKRFWRSLADLWREQSDRYKAMLTETIEALKSAESALPDGPIYWSADETGRMICASGLRLADGSTVARKIADETVAILRERAAL